MPLPESRTRISSPCGYISHRVQVALQGNAAASRLPLRPAVAFVSDRTHRGRYRHKDLHARSGKLDAFVAYVEYEDERDIADAKAASTAEALTARWRRQDAAGLHVESTAPFALGAASGYEIRLRLDARSRANKAPFESIDWVRIFWIHGRYFKVDCAAAADEWSSCERVLRAFAREG